MCLNPSTLVLAVTLTIGNTTTHGTEAIMKCYDRPSVFITLHKIDKRIYAMKKKHERARIAQMKMEGKG